ncbi:MAG: hypothetical protein ACFCUI_01735 [Bernardetiaceae bacterium]
MQRQNLVFIFALMVLAFGVPILGLFDKPVLLWGLPLLYVYVFGVWLGFIFLLAIVLRRNR